MILQFLKSRLFVVAAIFLWQQIAMASIQVFPTRVLLTAKNKSASVTVRNKSNDTKTYKIKSVFYRQGANGEMEKVDTPSADENSALEFLRFSPRTVTLKPNEEQVIRVQVTKPNKGEDFDYRAHLRLEEDEKPPTVSKEINKDKKLSMTLEARMAISINVIYQGQKSDFGIKFTNLKYTEADKKNPAIITAKVEKTGSGFAFGTVRIKYKGSDGVEKTVSEIKGFNSYLPERMAEMPISNPENVVLGKGKLIVEFWVPDRGDNSEDKENLKINSELEI